MATVGERIREQRKLKGLTERQLAQKTGMTQDKVSKIESGARGVSGSELYNIATALGVRPEQLLHDPLLAYYREGTGKPGTPAALAVFDRFVENFLGAKALMTLHEGVTGDE